MFTSRNAMFITCLFAAAAAYPVGIVYDGYDGPGSGKHIVLLAADDEYRSEELIPQLGKILAVHHGFKCTVLFALDPDTGAIDPEAQDNVPGLEVLEDADLMIMFLRFRALPEDQMKHIMNYTNSGKPMMALRTSTHPFQYPPNSDSPYKHLTWTSKDPEGGYGRQVFGETWVAHYGEHQEQSTRGVVAPGMEDHPIVKHCGGLDIWGPSDVYEITTLTGDSEPVVLGQVLAGMSPDDPPAEDKTELMPIAWTKTYTGTEGKPARVFTTTMGHAHDLKSEGVRCMLVSAAYWSLGMEDEIPEKPKVDFVGEYDPTEIGFGTHRVGVMPSEHALTKGK